ncbi:MAG: hypothetical protein PHV17_05175 [Candidatus Omnitrophica bacterium]|nr:hypothetical protein [Candidatus Omnitrophota bacterium]
MFKVSALFSFLGKTCFVTLFILIISGSFLSYSDDKNKGNSRKDIIGSYLDNLSFSDKSENLRSSLKSINCEERTENKNKLSFSPAMARRIEKDYRELLISNNELVKENNFLKQQFTSLAGSNRDYSFRVEALKSNLTELRNRLKAIEESLDNL